MICGGSHSTHNWPHIQLLIHFTFVQLLMTSLTSSHFSTSGTFTCPSARHLPVSSVSHSDVYYGGEVEDTITHHWLLVGSPGPNSSLQNLTVHNTLTINHSLSIEPTGADPSRKLYRSRQLSSIVGPTSFLARLSRVEETSLQYGQHVSGDLGLHTDHLRLGAGVFHLANGLLEGVITWWDSHHHSYLLVQSVEGLCHRFNRSLQLQRLSLDAGAGWSALFHTGLLSYWISCRPPCLSPELFKSVAWPFQWLSSTLTQVFVSWFKSRRLYLMCRFSFSWFIFIILVPRKRSKSAFFSH